MVLFQSTLCHAGKNYNFLSWRATIFESFFTIFGRKSCNYIRKFGDYLEHSALEQRLSVFVDIASELRQNDCKD